MKQARSIFNAWLSSARYVAKHDKPLFILSIICIVGIAYGVFFTNAFGLKNSQTSTQNEVENKIHINLSNDQAWDYPGSPYVTYFAGQPYSADPVVYENEQLVAIFTLDLAQFVQIPGQFCGFVRSDTLVESEVLVANICGEPEAVLIVYPDGTSTTLSGFRSAEVCGGNLIVHEVASHAVNYYFVDSRNTANLVLLPHEAYYQFDHSCNAIPVSVIRDYRDENATVINFKAGETENALTLPEGRRDFDYYVWNGEHQYGVIRTDTYETVYRANDPRPVGQIPESGFIYGIYESDTLDAIYTYNTLYVRVQDGLWTEVSNVVQLVSWEDGKLTVFVRDNNQVFLMSLQ